MHLGYPTDMTHAHERTLLAKLGFQDPDLKYRQAMSCLGF